MRQQAPEGFAERASLRPLSDEEDLPVPALVALKRTTLGVGDFKVWVQGLPSRSGSELLAQLATIKDPLEAWAVHQVLTARAIAPVVRAQPADASPQLEFITFAADLAWLRRNHPEHRPAFKGWARAWAHDQGSEEWHLAVHRQWCWLDRRNAVAHLGAKGLALTEGQRQYVWTMPTVAMAADRRKFRPGPFQDLGVKLRAYARAHPDRSGKHSAEVTARRRADLYRVHVLLGRSPSRTATTWAAITGRPISRQATSKQLAAVDDALRWWTSQQ